MMYCIHGCVVFSLLVLIRNGFDEGDSMFYFVRIYQQHRRHRTVPLDQSTKWLVVVVLDNDGSLFLRLLPVWLSFPFTTVSVRVIHNISNTYHSSGNAAIPNKTMNKWFNTNGTRSPRWYP